MYRRLEVPPEASAEQIGRAYRRLAHSIHPDAHPEDPDAGRRFQEITEAYEILSDPARRAGYDRNRLPQTTNKSQHPDSGASPNTVHLRATPLVGQRAADPPTVIGLGSSPRGSAPLIAGPVHIAPPSNPAGAPLDPTSATDLAQFVDALFRHWGWR
ncbi:MAG: J domain-containing protein [Acidimicrobiaceae bacterium]|nr:J domain-containing protein [Acidimicrobiaceae bacterium]